MVPPSTLPSGWLSQGPAPIVTSNRGANDRRGRSRFMGISSGWPETTEKGRVPNLLGAAAAENVHDDSPPGEPFLRMEASGLVQLTQAADGLRGTPRVGAGEVMLEGAAGARCVTQFLQAERREERCWVR